MISDNYRELNKQMHADRPAYGAAGHLWAEQVKYLCAINHTQDVLDYGAGKGTLKLALGIDIAEYDPAIDGIADMPAPHDIVVCTDVLEHIEPEYIDAVLEHIRSLTNDCALLVIALRPAHKNLPDGRNAHILVHDRDWWLNKLANNFNVSEIPARQEGEMAVVVTPATTELTETYHDDHQED